MHYSHPFNAIERNSDDGCNRNLIHLSLLLIVIALAASVLTLVGIYNLAWTGPFRDIWEFIGDIRAQLQGNWSWSYLIDAYGGAHRILLPKLIFWADYRFFNGSNFLTLTLSLVCQCLSLFLCWHVWRVSTLPRWLQYSLFAGFIALLFNAGQLFNFLYAMDVQWFMANIFALIAIILVTQTSNGKNYSAALIFAILASLCNFTGLMAVILLVIYGYFYHRKHNNINYCALAIIAAVYTLWYVNTGKSSENLILNGFTSSRSLAELAFQTINTLTNIVPFVLKMLSNPFSRDFPLVGSALALISIVFLCQQTWQIKRAPSTAKHVAIIWCWYIFLGCAFTALGRILYPNSATAERYLTLTLPYTLLIISLLWLQCRNDKTQRIAGLITIPFLLWFYGSTSIDSLEKMSLTSQQQYVAQAAARSHVLDLDNIRGSLSFPMAAQGHNAVAEFNAWLHSENLAYARNSPPFQLHDDLHVTATAELPLCTFIVHQQQTQIDGHIKLVGEMHSSELAPLHLLFGDGERVIGFGYNSTVAGAWLPWRENPTSHRRFTGFINHLALAKNSSSAVWQAIGFDKRGRALCQSSFTLP